MTAYSLFNKAFSENAKNKALRMSDGEFITFQQLREKAEKVAFELRKRGVEDGSSVCITMARSPEYLVAVAACLLFGYAFVPLDEAFPEERISSIKEDSKAVLCIDAEFYEKAMQNGKPGPCDIPSQEPSEDSLAYMVYTSGSTGKPKGIMHSQKSFSSAVSRLVDVFGCTSEDVWGATAPFSFVALVIVVMPAWVVGASVIVVPRSLVKDPELLTQTIKDNGITVSFIPPKIIRYVKNTGSKFRLAITGSERVTNTFSNEFDTIIVYGQSEACGPVSCFKLDKAYENSPLGFPLEGVSIYILDEEGNKAEQGEICFSGDFMSGYMNLKEQTEKVLVKNPFAEQDGHKWLIRSGDIGRYTEDGNMIFVERKDWMLKINGQRVEPGEIEAALRSVEYVKDAAVKGFPNKYGQTYACAYYTADKALSASSVRKAVSEKLPQYMVPSFFVQLDKMPLNTNGKLDKSALKEPESSMFTTEYKAPENFAQKLICSAFEKILEIERVGIQDDFFMLGGDSFKAVLLSGECSAVKLSVKDVLSGRTPEGMAALVSENTEDDWIIDSNISRIPLTNSQMGIYLECADSEPDCKYNIPFEYSFPLEKFSAKDIKDAFESVVSSFQAFSCSIETDNGIPVMVRDKFQIINVEIAKSTEEEFEKAKKNFVKPFVFGKDRLYRAEIYETEYYVHLLFDMHHVLFDGTSLNVLNNALASVLDDRKLQKETITPFMVASMETKEKSLAEQKANIEYFVETLDNPDVDSKLIPDVDNQEDFSLKGVYETTLDEGIVETEAFTFANGITENTLFCAAFALTLSCYSGQSESLFTSVESGRQNQEMNNTIGMFVRSYPVYIKRHEKQKTSEYLKDVQNRLFSAISHDNLSFADLAKACSIDSSIKFVYQAELLNGFETRKTVINAKPIEIQQAMSDLDIMVIKKPDGYRVSISYRKALYSPQLIKHFADALNEAVKELTVCESLDSINLLCTEEQAFIDSINNTDEEFDRTQTVVSIFEKTASECPENIAVSFKDKEITYREFDRLTDNLASEINRMGLGRGDYIAILCNKSELMPVCAFGAVKSGAAYQPLDPTYPKDRLDFMVKDSGARLLIADRVLAGLLPDFKGKVLFTDQIASLADGGKPEYANEPEDPFCLLYTSGTTGLPKGVVLEQRNFVSFHYVHGKNIGITRASKQAFFASFGFDAGVMDVFSTILSGATLCIIPEEIRLDLPAIEDFIEKNKITHIFMTTQLGCLLAQSKKLKSLKTFFVGGEKLIPFTKSGDFRFCNYYGPTESICYVCGYEVVNNSKIQPIGRPNKNIRLYVVDKLGRRVPAGACGELWISGGQVCRSYLNRPDKTAEVFIDNPFTDSENYRRVYRSGDIVRLLPTGDIDFVGRRDGQVKVRGFRVELSEVDQVIRQYTGIKNSTVQAFDDPSGGKYLAAYIASDSKVDISELGRFISERKPSYMVPAVTMQLDEIPLNVNGKVDRRKLPVPTREAEEIVQPENETQKRILKVVSSVLGTDKIGITSDFFACGLSSIGLVRLNSLLSDEFGLSFQSRDIRKNSTAKALEILISELLTSKEKEPEVETSVLNNATLYADYPLTKTQEGIFFECAANLESTFYNIPLLLKISAELDIQRLKAAVCQTVQAHSYINTTLFYDENGNIRQKRAPFGSFTQENIEVLKAEKIEDITPSLVRPHKLVGGKLFRISIIQADATYLFIDMHHIICDGMSMNIFIDDLQKAYSGCSVSDETFSGFEVSVAEQKLRNSKDYFDAKEYYENLLSGFDTDFLPKSDIHSRSEKGSGKLRYEGKDGVASAVSGFFTKNKGGENALLCSAFGFILSKYCGSDYSVFNTIYNGRSDSRTGRTVSMLVKTLPVLFNPKESVRDTVSEMSDQIMNSMSNDIYSYAEISHEFGLSSNVMFIFQGNGFEFSEFCNKPCSEIKLNLSEEKMALSVQVTRQGSHYSYLIEYNKDIYTDLFVSSMAHALDKVISEFCLCDRVENISTLDEEEAELLDSYNNTDSEFDRNLSVVDMLNKHIQERPDSLAVSFKDKTLTYREFGRITDKLGAFISSKNIEKDQYISILIDRSQFMAITAWGVIKSGHAYQPLDPTYPGDRLEMMVNDSKTPLMILDRKYSNLIENFKGEVLFTDEIENLPEVENCSVEIKPEDPLILIYSSGSTGVPKGSILIHLNIVSFFHHYSKNALLDESSRYASYASFGFDAGMMDIFCVPMAGGALFIIPEEIRLDLIQMEKFYVENSITNGFMTTQVARTFLINTKCSSLRAFLFGGEKMNPFTPPENILVVNGYGPSETTNYITSYTLKDDNPLQPIGRQNVNSKLYVVNPSLKRVAPGMCGELCISGPQVALGYLNRPEKTAQSFIRNPFCSENDYSRLYRTGDVVRLLPDGNYDFVGRRDGQVKIRGFRVELGEIENCILEFPGIKETTVQAFDDPAGGKYVAAYVVSDERVDFEQLAAFIGKTKPSYMVPATFAQIDRIPLTSNGKVNKGKLPVGEKRVRESGVEPSNEMEVKLCNLFAELLGLEKVYADDDFFAIGGTSISALQLVVKCDKAGLKFVYKNLFENPTPQKLASLLAGKSQEKDYFAPSGDEAAKHDYSALKYNVIENLAKIKSEPIGDVLLTGVTGFLGIHVLKVLLSTSDSKVICLIRKKKDLTPKQRLNLSLNYYFEDDFESLFDKRIFVVEGDITDAKLSENLSSYHFDTIINCAANVKHFGTEESLMHDNFLGIDNLIKLALSRNARLVQTSSLSVSGESVNGHIPLNKLLAEHELNIGQSLENMYVRTKYLAEEAVIDAISKQGLRGKIIRLGNLMGRGLDGEFQINSNSSAFMRIIRGYSTLGCYPIDMLDVEIECSPIDYTAKAVVLLSGTPDSFTVFHANNCHKVHMANIIEILNEAGFRVDYVSPEEFSRKYNEMMSDERYVDRLSGLLAYMNKSDGTVSETVAKTGSSSPDATGIRLKIGQTNAYTVKALYRLGFSWSLTDRSYIKSLIENLIGLGFFGID